MNEQPRNISGQPPPDDPSDYHIEATESLVERTLRTLKQDDLFGVFDQQGNINGAHGGPDGIYFQDTRFLSHFLLALGGVEPLQLGSVLLDDNGAMVVDVTNADLYGTNGRVWLMRDSIHLSRFKFIKSTVSYERIRLRCFGPIGRPVPLDVEFDADFADLFEVRGERRPKRGSRTVDIVSSECVEFRYTGVDDLIRRTRVTFEPAPDELTVNSAHWQLDLDESSERSIKVSVCCATNDEVPQSEPIAKAFRAHRGGRRRYLKERAQVISDNPLFNAVVARSWSDLDMLVTETSTGPYPYAGIPWYSTIFGRDGIITAIQMLWCAPYIAKGVLQTLASLQADRIDPAADAQPGKILHEMRGGEMANLGEVPFKRYYGSVDATPLFVVLAGLYHERTGDLETIRQIWPNIVAALAWINDFGDVDGDGFVEYQRMRETGLGNQGWKDSSDSIFHADGRLAHGPIALVEVQAYVYAAKRGAANLARCLADDALADRLERDADRLRSDFEQAFWIEEIGTYALALDGPKSACAVRSSNAGHCLFARIASPERAELVGKQLVGPAFFSGWGVRTIAAGEARYNPMSYHNGSVWPHDNAMIALGLGRYGMKHEAQAIMSGLFDAATYDDLRRLPELFCGFVRRRRQGPTSYPVACSPQAWAAAAPFALITALIGLETSVVDNRLTLEKPVLPKFLSTLRLDNVVLGKSRVDLRLARAEEDVTAAVLHKSGDAIVQILK